MGRWSQWWSRLFGAAGFEQLGEVLATDLGPGVSAYSGGGYYYSSGDGSGWPHGMSVGANLSLDHTLLRHRARIAYHDSMPARALVERFADIIPGIGLRFDSTPRAEALGLTPAQAEQWGADVAGALDLFLSSKKFTLAETETGYQAQRLATIMQFRDGEYFARLHYSSRGDLLNPLQVSFIDQSQICGDAITETDGYQSVGGGIEYDASGREIAYNIRFLNPSTRQYERVRVPRVGARSGRPMMLHGFQREYPGQRRGYSRLAHALQAFKNFTDFEYAHIRKAINDAAIALSVKPSADRPAINPFADAVSGPAGPLQAPVAPGEPSSGDGGLNYSELNTVNFRPDSVGVFNLQAGEELQEFRGSTPAQNYDTFTRAFLTSLSSASSMPAEVLWMQFGQNYSASRATLVLLWQVVEIWRAELEADFLAPLIPIWLSGEIAAGRVRAPGWSDPRLRAAWCAGRWVGFPMPSIDPLKAAKADQLYAALGAKTLDRIAQECNGSSGRANRARLAREFDELPIAPWDAKEVPDDETP